VRRWPHHVSVTIYCYVITRKISITFKYYLWMLDAITITKVQRQAAIVSQCARNGDVLLMRC